MSTSYNDNELSRSNRFLGSVLMRVLNDQSHPEISSQVEQFQNRFTNWASAGNKNKLKQLGSSIEKLNLDTISSVMRVFNHYFSLLNIAEESYYLDLRRQQAEQGGHYWPNSFHDTLLTFKNSGVSAHKLRVLLDELLYLPVKKLS